MVCCLSAARGEMEPDSHINLLVVKSGVADRGRLAEEIHLQFFGRRFRFWPDRMAVDVVLELLWRPQRLDAMVPS